MSKSLLHCWSPSISFWPGNLSTSLEHYAIIASDNYHHPGVYIYRNTARSWPNPIMSLALICMNLVVCNLCRLFPDVWTTLVRIYSTSNSCRWVTNSPPSVFLVVCQRNRSGVPHIPSRRIRKIVGPSGDTWQDFIVYPTHLKHPSALRLAT